METKTFKGILLLAVLSFPAAVLSQSRGEFLRGPEGNTGYGRSSAQPEYYDSRQPSYYQHQSQSQIHPSPDAYNANAYGQPAYAPPPPAWQSQDQTSYYQQPSPQNYNQQPYPQIPNQQPYPQNFNQQPQSQNFPPPHPPRPFNPILAGIPRPQLPVLRPQGNKKPSKPNLSVDNRFASTSNGQQTGSNQPTSQSGDFDTTRATQSPTRKKKPTTTMSPPPTFNLDNRFDVRDKVSKTLSFNPEISAAMEVFALRSMLTFNAFINEDNFMFSPFSIFHLLSLIAEGARGSTLRELNTELGLKDTLKTRDFQQYLNVALNRTTADVVLRKFSMLVTDINRPVSREYESTIEKVYDADVFPVDFRDVRTTEKIINGNVSEQTQGLITDTVTREDLFKAQMILISGLFFQGNWANVFNKTFTKREAFHDTNMNKVGEVNMMFQRGPFAYSAVKDLGCHILELPYAESPASRNDGFGTGLSMILVLPRKGLELSEAIENVHRHGLERIYRELNTARTEYEDDEVEVHVPRFEIATNLNLKETLEAMGIKEIFEQNADLSGINTNYYVSAMVHKTKISVDEKGTTAAAVTTSIFANKATPPKFHANKPFLFFIVDRVTKMILFSGQYVAPEVY